LLITFWEYQQTCSHLQKKSISNQKKWDQADTTNSNVLNQGLLSIESSLSILGVGGVSTLAPFQCKRRGNMNFRDMFWYFINIIKELVTEKKKPKKNRKFKKRSNLTARSCDSPITNRIRMERVRKQSVKLVILLFILSLFGSCCKRSCMFSKAFIPKKHIITKIDLVTFRPVK